MGNCCSKAQYEFVRRIDDDAWHNWDGHFARKLYDIDRTLGKGAFSEVVAATQRDTGRRVALKVVFLDNPRLTADHAAILRDEVAIIESLRHPNVVTFDCVMEDPVRRQVVIAEEILLGGTLTEELGAAAANNDDRLLAHVFRQLLSALAHVHGAGIVHRDLKPDNVMFRAPAGEWAHTGAVPVVIDFGMSTRVRPGAAPIVGLLGSPGFVAPEVINGGPHTAALDMFALGVMLYICVAGRRPMTPKQANTLAYADREAWEHAHMPADELWQTANPRVRSLVLQLLERDAAKRISAEQALQHPWVTADMRTPRPLSLRPDAASVAAERRLKLTAERKQSTVEEMLRYMILALRERQQARSGDPRTAPGTRGATPALSRHPSASAHPVLTSVSAPQAGSATSFFQWMQQHLEEGDETQPAAEDARGPAWDGTPLLADAEESRDNTSSEWIAAQRPLLRDARCHSDMTHEAAVSNSGAATAARRHDGRAPACAAASSAASPADLLVQSHLERHLSLVRHCSGSLQQRAAPGGSRADGDASASGELISSTTDVSATDSAEHPSTSLPIDSTGSATAAQDAGHAMPGDRSDATPSLTAIRDKEISAPSHGSSRLTAEERPRAASPGPRVRFSGAAGLAQDSKRGGGGATVEAAVVDSFPLYRQGKGDRLYSVVLAASRRARAQESADSRAVHAAPLFSQHVQGGGPGGGVAVPLEEIAAVAQVEWGLRRWRQLAKRVPPPASRPNGGRTLVVAPDALPDDVKQARNIAELALRFRGVGL